MRKRPLLLLILLLSLFTPAASAQALALPEIPGAAADTSSEEADDTGSEEGEPEDEASDEGDECTIEDEEDVQLCAEIVREEREEAEAERCVIEDATARVAADPGNNTVRLTIRYQALLPAAVAIDATLRGPKGKLHLGAGRTRFRRAGTFHDSFGLSERLMEKALAAREFAIDVQAVNTPRSCRFHITAHRGGGGKRLWS
jgi:hypothetical protein